MSTPRNKPGKVDLDKPHSLTRGLPGIRFRQDDKLYAPSGEYVRDANPATCQKRKKVVAPKQSPRARKPKNKAGITVEPRTDQERMILEIGNINTIPKSVLDARKENRAARAAEELAD
jgi:hypothetical protein